MRPPLPDASRPALISVIVATYNQPQHLERVLWGYARQTDRAFEIIVADDGSGPETKAVVDRMAGVTGVALRHVWQEDSGFRKNRILNVAIHAAAGSYLLFSDGDCVPPPTFVATHRRLSRPGHYLSGHYVKIDNAVTARVTVEAVQRGDATRYDWLRQNGAPRTRHTIRLGLHPAAAWALDHITRAFPNFNGCNTSVWRADAFRVNGFEERMVYGYEDHEFGRRLRGAGVVGVQVRYRAPVLHLEHARPYMGSNDGAINMPILAERRSHALVGLEQHGRAAP